MTRDIEHTIREQLSALPPDVVAVYLFGSVARGTAGPRSDVDVALLYARPPAPTLASQPLAFEAVLERSLGRKVQVVVLNLAPIDLIHRVLRDGRLLHDAAPSTRIRFEVKARNEYFDLLPILQRYRRPGAA